MRLYESETIELKEDYTPDLKKEIVAFANTNGGTIYVGVQDNGEIVGLDNVDFVIQQISNSLRDSIRPDVSMFTNIELLHVDNKHFVKLTVSQGTRKPYYLSDRGLKPTGVYLRSGTTSVPTSEDAIRMMIKMTDGDSFESNRSLIQELTYTPRKLVTYILDQGDEIDKDRWNYMKHILSGYNCTMPMVSFIESTGMNKQLEYPYILFLLSSVGYGFVRYYSVSNI